MKQPGKAERSRSWQVPVETGFGFFLSLSIFLLMDHILNHDDIIYFF